MSKYHTKNTLFSQYAKEIFKKSVGMRCYAFLTTRLYISKGL